MNTFNIASLASAVGSAHSANQKARKSHTYVEWFVVLLISTLFLVGIAIWSTYVYGDVVNRLSIENATVRQNSELNVDERSLTETLAHFEKKKGQYEALSTSRSIYKDPSR